MEMFVKLQSNLGPEDRFKTKMKEYGTKLDGEEWLSKLVPSLIYLEVDRWW